MNVTAVVERIEDGVAFLFAEEFLASFKVPENLIQGVLEKGSKVIVTLATSGNFTISH